MMIFSSATPTRAASEAINVHLLQNAPHKTKTLPEALLNGQELAYESIMLELLETSRTEAVRLSSLSIGSVVGVGELSILGLHLGSRFFRCRKGNTDLCYADLGSRFLQGLAKNPRVRGHRVTRD